jgi:hypothetical protein
MIFMAVQRTPEWEDGRRLKYRCRSSVGTLIGIGTLRQTRGLDAKPLMDADVANEADRHASSKSRLFLQILTYDVE